MIMTKDKLSVEELYVVRHMWVMVIFVSSPDLIRCIHVYCFQYNAWDNESNLQWVVFGSETKILFH